MFDVLNAFHPLLFHLCDIIIRVVEALENSFMTCLMGSILLLEVVENIAYTQTVTAGFIGVSGAYALACRTNLVLSFGCFIGSIEQTVSRHDEVCLL